MHKLGELQSQSQIHCISNSNSCISRLLAMQQMQFHAKYQNFSVPEMKRNLLNCTSKQHLNLHTNLMILS